MKTLIDKLLLVSICYILVGCSICCGSVSRFEQPAKKIGIIMPIEHRALLEISAGFQETLKGLYEGPIIFKVGNAQGDINLQRAIISQMRDANYDLMVPITTTVAQMTAAMVGDQPIVGLAADLAERKNNLVIVDDELDKEKIIAFVHKVYPELKSIALIYSSSDKIFSEVKKVHSACEHHHIELHRLMIQNLVDLYSVSQAIPKDAGAVFILKDSLVASGISTLVQIAKKYRIPLITSDDGTVQQGASFAVGISERDIGVEGAKLAAQILHGTAPDKLLTVKLTKPIVFVNLSALASLGQNLAPIKSVAKGFHYPVVNKFLTAPGV